uniref:ATP synthase F0 subunit 8 n=1 Tax=Panorpa fulvastra TaxID=1105294 RepID=UPI002551DDD5|nr:ATP synthase F0 subunit 8 [Panorpa fulvastra]WGT92269.1 ATP synthase F0 subunit 8 [Panorpa fulvastra]
MPQMAPINWLSLFIMFSMTLLLFNIMNYYSYTPKPNNVKEVNKISSLSSNWKW